MDRTKLQLDKTRSVRIFRDLVRRFRGNVVCANISRSRAEISGKRGLCGNVGISCGDSEETLSRAEIWGSCGNVVET